MKRKKNALIVFIISFAFVVLISGTLMTSRATFYKVGSRTKLFSGVITQRHFLMSFIVNDVPKSGTDAVSSSPWILSEDHTGEWRYAGKNPDNYILFNGELWRIIGVMPNMTYCTGTYGTDTECSTTSTGSLVKIIRNDVVGTFLLDYKQTGVGSSTATTGSNDWSDAQLMLMLNGGNYLKTSYDIGGNQLHSNYGITVSTKYVMDGPSPNGHDFFNTAWVYLGQSFADDYDENAVTIPSTATTSSYPGAMGTVSKKILSSNIDKIATVKWDLYGTDSYSSSNPTSLYNIERNINGSGAVYSGTSPENRPVYWYGKVGLMYPSDYGYATNGGSTYNRVTCLGHQIYGWSSGSYKTDCAGNSYLWYTNITSLTGSAGTYQWMISPYTGNDNGVFCVVNTGRMTYCYASNTGINVRPSVYLKPDVEIIGGNGTWSNPYTIEAKQYWFDYTDCTETSPCSFPNYGDELVNNPETPVYVAQDSSKYYVCTTIPDEEDQSHEVCLSQDYTQYGLYGVTLNESSTFSSSQQNSVKSALQQVLANSGTTIDIDEDCFSDQSQVFCQVSSGTSTTFYWTLTVLSNGTVVAGYSHRPQYRSCMINRNGQVSCSISAP